jgi:hypothetical protein
VAGRIPLNLPIVGAAYNRRMKTLIALGLLLAPDALTLAEFEKLHKELVPPTGEAWRTIPWKVSLLEARETAAKERKPIFMWSMDGHPLGCT